jgi:transcription elongation factor GreB
LLLTFCPNISRIAFNLQSVAITFALSGQGITMRCLRKLVAQLVIIFVKMIMKTPLITREGLEKLKAELEHLWRVERPDTTQKVSWAASLGDRSENADYHYNKKRLREIDRRVLYLRKCIDDLKVVDYSPFQEGKILFGAWVEIKNDRGEQKRFRIVGYDEIFDTKDYISIDSPMARALIKKEVGDEAVVKTDAGEFVWHVTKIEYQK